MSDEESEMAALRQSSKFQSSLHNKSKQEKQQTHSPASETRSESQDSYSPTPSLKNSNSDKIDDDFKVPMSRLGGVNRNPNNQNTPIISRETLMSQQFERQEMLRRSKNVNYERANVSIDRSSNEPIIISSGDISDINLVKLQQQFMNSEDGGMAYMNEDQDDDEQSRKDRRQQEIERYKKQLMEEYEEETRRKQQNLQKKNLQSSASSQSQYVPVVLGKDSQKLNRMSTEEISKVHSQHKRAKIEVQKVAKKQDFEINQDEEEDDDFAGPKLDLFQKNDNEDSEDDSIVKQNQLEESERNRKLNQIYRNTKDVLGGNSSTNNDIDSDDDMANQYNLPITHEVVLQGHQRSIQAMDIDLYGNRMVTGGLDFILKIWDFPGMNRKLKSMREYKPFDGHPVNALSFDPDGENFLCCCGNNQARIYNRDGGKVQTTIRGDMYISDMANTKGHVAAILDGKWHPVEKKNFMTASLDGSIRLWNIESKTVGVDQNLMHEQCIKAHNTKGQKVAINSCTFSSNGNLIVGGCADGSVQIWDRKFKSFHRPTINFTQAHTQGSEVSCVKFFKDDKRLVTRAMDDTLKLWDIRNTKHPFQEWKDLINLSSKTNVSISPDERLVLTGTSVRKGFGYGLLVACDVQTGEIVNQSAIAQESVIQVFWHPSINQIVVGSADSNIRVLYDPKLSERGITTSLVKLEKRKPIDGITIFNRPILTPSVYEDEKEKEMEKDPWNPNNQNAPSAFIPPEVLDPQHRKDKIRNDPLLTRKPDMPLQGPLGRGGKFSSSGTYTQYLMRNLVKNDSRDQDAREALLAVAKEAAENPQWIAPAYHKTQPKTIYDTSEIKREDLKFLENSSNKKCAHCGLKFCTCKQKK
ncbi:wd repeat-containing protein 70 [Stylonychia lemnae]|uniref:Wd repeat-containing protein 70 n=1 Tax=Stylonychia lemnae TaxID=5949 RepID=A0A078AV95_STYLE|nr:wd repeat-containing protein 70 [Stylonychia lemnae]|eukprot:CDW85197.1 wd repeat-containing protein 70 [Stylonychia lemnae]